LWLIVSIILLTCLLSIVIGHAFASSTRTGVTIVTGLGNATLCYLIVITFPLIKKSIAYAFLIPLLSIPGLIIGYLLWTEALVLGTSLLGSYCFLRGISSFIGHFPSEMTTFKSIINNERLVMDPWYFCYIGAYFLICIGMAYWQVR